MFSPAIPANLCGTQVHDMPWPLDTRKSLELTYLEGFTRCIQVGCL